MTTGVLMPGIIYATSSGLNPATESRIPVAQPFLFLADPTILVGTLSLAHRNALAKTLTGGRPATSFEYSDWYNRIHILPSLLALGNVVNLDVSTVGVWNAWLAVARTLSSITPTAATGISISGQPSPPLVFALNQQRNYTITTSDAGPPVIDASYAFTFTDGETVSVAITGRRLTAWALTPDWTNPVVEKLAWKTDPLRAWSGREQRRALRIAPRRSVSFQTPMTKVDKQYVENELFAWGALIWALPIWWDGQLLAQNQGPGDTVISCFTADRDFVAGGLAILIASPAIYEVVSVGSIGTSPQQLNLSRPVLAAWPAGSKLYPVRSARLLSTTRIVRSHMSYAELQPQFDIIEPCDWPAATGLVMYRGAPVLEDSPDTDSQAEGSYDRETFTIDNESGAITVIDTAELGFPTNSHNWFLKGRTAHTSFRSLLYLLKGKQGELWVPSYESDLTMVQDVAPSDFNLHCSLAGVSAYAAAQNRQDIRIETKTGTIYYRRVTGAVQDSPTTELVSIDTAIGVTLKASNVRRISFMALSALSADEITIEHITTIRGIAISSTPFRAVNHDL